MVVPCHLVAEEQLEKFPRSALVAYAPQQMFFIITFNYLVFSLISQPRA